MTTTRPGRTTTPARSARERAAELRARTARREARRRSLLVSGAVLLVLAVAIGAVLLVRGTGPGGGTGAAPRNLSGDAIVVGAADAPVTVRVYEDFQCPACAAFGSQNAARLRSWVDAGTVRVEYRPIAFLDRASTDRYSSRALNAAAAVVDLAPEAFPAFHDALFAAQPREGGPGLSDGRLVDLAVSAGAPRDAVAAAVRDRTHAGWVRRATENASKAGVTGTPTVVVDGRTLPSYAPEELERAVREAQG